MIRRSVACRRCNAGWWEHNVGSICPHCRAALHTTGVVTIVDLPEPRRRAAPTR